MRTTGDGFFVLFEGPARAVRCALALVEAVRPLGLEIRAGLHIGEVELAGDDIEGLAIHIGARIAALAGTGEVLVSRTIKDLVVGSTLFIPVYTKGALFQIGDGHAGQGDGEVDLSALETSLSGTLQLFVRKDIHLLWPRAETPTHYITMGLHEDLNEATKMAVREMINFLTKEKHLTREDAYMLASVAADLHITQLVDGNKGVHMMISKEIFHKGVTDHGIALTGAAHY